jgi:hypothetical protein
MVYPVWQVLTALRGGGRYLPLSADVAGKVRGFVVEREGSRRIFLANQTSRPQRVQLAGLRGGVGPFRVMDAAVAGSAVRAPEAFGSDGPVVTAGDGVITLGAYASAWSA